MGQERDFYQLFDLAPSATGDEIHVAYRRLAKKHHPDNFYSYVEKNRANSKMQEINNAYAVLRDDSKRREYDRSRKDLQRARMFSSIFDEFLDHPWRTWAIAVGPLTLLIFLLLELDYYLGLHWITSDNFTVGQAMFLAVLLPVVFFNPFNVMVVWMLIAMLLTVILFLEIFLLRIPIMVISKGLKKGLGKTFYNISEASWRPIVDLSVHVSSLLVLILLAILFPHWILLLLFTFPYSLFLLFGLAAWVGETIAVVIFIYRARTIVATTDILLRN